MSLFKFLKSKTAGRVLAQRKPLLMHPDHVPRTMATLPQNLSEYRYVGPTVEMVIYKEMRRPAFVARMVRVHRSLTDTLVREEMTTSIRDLKDADHADVLEIAEALRVYYKKYVPPEQQEKALGLLLQNPIRNPKSSTAQAVKEQSENATEIEARLLEKLSASI